MAKNFKSLYDAVSDESALNQSWFCVEESTRGVLGDPVDSSFFFTRAGGSVDHQQPKQSSDHRSGRHNRDIIKEKKTTSWSIPTYVNIDTTQGSATSAEVEPAIRTMWKALLGYEDTAAGALYDPRLDPSITFSLYENGGKFATQLPSCFVEGMSFSAPGDSTATMDWSGGAADRFRVGIGKSTISNDGGNTITLATAAEAKRFPKGAKVMLVKYSDGLTRSTDTPNGSYRLVTDVNTATGVVTLDGAALADADGTVGGGILISYAEPESPTGIADIQTGLVGSMDINGLGGNVACMRSFSLEFANNLERVNYCYGTAALATPFYNIGGRLDISVSVEMNLNDNTGEWLYDLDTFTSQDLEFILGDASGRHLKIEMPKCIFDVPSVTYPESGSVPFSADGMAFETVSGGDEITVSYL